jgi:hypothetical protein
MAHAIPPEWTFEAAVTDLSGIRVTTTITVPMDAEWNDVRESGELAQMGAFVTANHVAKSIARSAEKEPPF